MANVRSPDAGPVLDVARALHDLRALSAPDMRGRETGSEGNTRARDYIVDQLRAAGVPALGPSYEHPFFWVQHNGVRRHGVNVLGCLDGRESPERVIVLSAHYDHLGTTGAGARGSDYSGADDNASGVAAVLAVARWLVDVRPRCTVVLAFFDGEEAELRGSRAFVLHPPLPLERVAVNVNVDMIGRARDGVLWVVGAHHTPALRPVLEPVVRAASLEMRFGHDRLGWVPGLAYDWTEESDHGAFHAAGIPFIYLGTVNDPETHTTGDEADTIDESFFAAALRATGDAVATIDVHLATAAS